MVSIIIPVYNVEKYINRCLTSVVNQTFKDIEIILINDGSIDKSNDICLQWAKKDERIIYISKKNEGLGVTRNMGVKIAKYDYITFLDSDDWWDIDYIEKMYNAAVTSNADIVVCDINYVQEKEDGLYETTISKLRINSGIVKTNTDKDLINKSRTFMWGKLYKKSLFLENNILQPDHAFEDVPITPLLIAKSSSIYHISEPLIFYLRNRKVSLANSFDSLRMMIVSLKELKNNFIESNLFLEYYKELKKLTFSQVRFAIRKMNENINVNMIEKITKVEDQLIKFLNENYKAYFEFDKATFSVVGSIFLKKIVQNIVFNDIQIVQYCSFAKLNGLAKADYVIIDFLEEQVEDNLENIKLKIDKIIEQEKSYNKKCKIILVKLKIPEVYGTIDNKNKFEKINVIRNKNKGKECIFEYIERLYTDVIVIDIDENLLFSENKKDIYDLNDAICWNIADKILFNLT